MKLLGVVQWTKYDKGGTPIAGVRPLFEIQRTGLRPIDAVEEFPSQGQVFWPSAQAAAEDALITFRAEPNAGQHKDEYKVVDARPAWEVLDLRRLGHPSDVRTALVAGVRLPEAVAAPRALIWCKPDIVVGPVELTHIAPATLRLTGTNLARVPSFTGMAPHSFFLSRRERFVRIDDGSPSGYVDWDDDAAVLRRALEAAVRIAKHDGRDRGPTKKQIEDAARAIATQGIGVDAQLDRYRLERALVLCSDNDALANLAPRLVELLREHPVVQARLDELSLKVRADVEQVAQVEIEQRLAREHVELKDAADSLARTKSELAAGEGDLLRLKGEIDALQGKAHDAVREAEAAIEARVLAALDRPMDILAQVSVLRPLLGGRGGPRSDAVSEKATPVTWPRARGESLRDRAGLQRALTGAARARGIEPSLMMQLHAAIVARLMPVVLGPGSLAALAAYAYGACGGRLWVMHMSPGTIHPRDLDEPPGGGLVTAREAARDIDGLSVVVLEGANRAPVEASVIPLLQLRDVALTDVNSAPTLRLTATLVAGATTVPISSQLWSHAVAIRAQAMSPTPQQASQAGDIGLTSDLVTPGDVPRAQIDELLEAWPDCAEVLPALERFGAALSRSYEGNRITEALLHGVVLPYLVTALGVEEQDEAMRRAGGADDVTVVARRLRRSLC